MTRIYTWSAKPAERNLTIAEMRGLKGQRVMTQVTANTRDEAAAAETAGFDMIICNAANTEAVRAGSSRLFLTAAIGLPDFPLPDDILREAFRVLALGADAVLTARSMAVVEMLAREEIPVMGHLGLVPRKSTWVGGLRAVGRTVDEAVALFQAFKDLENAGAALVEAEVIPAPIMAEISRRSGLITVSLGSGAGADVMYLFMSDICGEAPAAPRHARAYANLHELYETIKRERVRALTEFRADATTGRFPSEAESVSVSDHVVHDFTRRLDGM